MNISNLIKRVLTFVIIAPIVSVFILYEPQPYGILPFTVLLTVLGVLATNEFFTFTAQKDQENNFEWLGYLVILAMIMSAYMVEFNGFWSSEVAMIVSVSLGLFYLLELFRRKLFWKNSEIMLTLRAIFYIGWFFPYIVMLRGMEKGMAYLVYLIFCVAACDTFAYIYGIKFGKEKIAPNISPKKSVEGSVAGFLASIVVSVILGGHYLGLKHAIVMGMFIGFFGQAGDFFESLMKREFNVKDSGWILPGHGGIMDRLDNAIFVAPIVYFYLTMVVLK